MRKRLRELWFSARGWLEPWKPSSSCDVLPTRLSGIGAGLCRVEGKDQWIAWERASRIRFQRERDAANDAAEWGLIADRDSQGIQKTSCIKSHELADYSAGPPLSLALSPLMLRLHILTGRSGANDGSEALVMRVAGCFVLSCPASPFPFSSPISRALQSPPSICHTEF